MLVATLAVASGCHGQSGGDAAAAEAQADREALAYQKRLKWEESPTGVRQASVSVAQGTTPLVHLFALGGPIRVVDLTSNAQLIALKVSDQTLVRIDDRNGVTVGKTNVYPGPLPAGHTYGIFLDPTTENVIRQGIGPAGDFSTR